MKNGVVNLLHFCEGTLRATGNTASLETLYLTFTAVVLQLKQYPYLFRTKRNNTVHVRMKSY